MSIKQEPSGEILTIIIDRPGARNAVDRPTAEALYHAFLEFDRNPAMKVAVLWGSGGNFCAGADLKAMGSDKGNRVAPDGPGPMGPSRMVMSKPVIAAVSGYAVAGGLELAVWCDLRVVEESAIFGVFCRRWGVPLIDGGTVRLPRLIGHSRAMDMILTGRPIPAKEAYEIGLANRIVPAGKSREEAETLAREIAAFPQACMRADRMSAIEQEHLPVEQALKNEFAHGQKALTSPELGVGIGRFQSGAGRGGTFG